MDVNSVTECAYVQTSPPDFLNHPRCEIRGVSLISTTMIVLGAYMSHEPLTDDDIVTEFVSDLRLYSIHRHLRGEFAIFHGQNTHEESF